MSVFVEGKHYIAYSSENNWVSGDGMSRMVNGVPYTAMVLDPAPSVISQCAACDLYNDMLPGIANTRSKCGATNTGTGGFCTISIRRKHMGYTNPNGKDVVWLRGSVDHPDHPEAGTW